MTKCNEEQKPCENCSKECNWHPEHLFDWIDELWQEETYGKVLGG